MERSRYCRCMFKWLRAGRRASTRFIHPYFASTRLLRLLNRCCPCRPSCQCREKARTPQQSAHSLTHLRSSGTLWRAELEAVLELAWDTLKRSHSAGAGGLSPLRLLAPVVCHGSVSQFPSCPRLVRPLSPDLPLTCSFQRKKRTFANASTWVTTICAGVLLDVKRAAACINSSSACGYASRSCSNVPQRLHRTCVLLWRFPNEEVPFAVGRMSVFVSQSFMRCSVLIVAD